MNLLQIRNRTREKLNITSTTDISNAFISGMANEGYSFICSKISQINEDFFEEQKAKFNLGLNSALYSLPTDFVKLKQLRLAYTAPDTEDDYVIANRYQPGQVGNVSVDELTTPTSSPIFDLTNNYFRIYPTPDVAVTNGGELYYIALPSALANTASSPVIPSPFHDLLATYAAREGAMKLSLTEKWGILNSEWNQGISRIESELAERDIDNDGRIRNVLETTRNLPVRELY